MKTLGSLSARLTQGSAAIFRAFLEKVRTEIVEKHRLKSQSVLISYAPEPAAEGGLTQQGAEALGRQLRLWGFGVQVAALKDVGTLQPDLLEVDFAVLLGTPTYAALIKSNPRLREALIRFGDTRADALHPLICDTGFLPDTQRFALMAEIVPDRFLVRDFRAAFAPQDALASVGCAMAVLFDLSGAQGLGLIPNCLNLDKDSHRSAHDAYQVLFEAFLKEARTLSLDYTLGRALLAQCSDSAFKHYFDPEHAVFQNLAEDVARLHADPQAKTLL